MKNVINNARRALIIFFGAIMAMCVCFIAATTITSAKAEGNTEHIEDVSAYTLVDYVTVQNADVGADPAGFTDPSYSKYYSYDTAYATTSMVYKFKYKAIDNATYVYLRDAQGGWKGYTFIFANGCVQYHVNGTKYDVGGLLTAGTTYEIELGSIDTTTTGKTYIYVKIDGEYKVQRITDTLTDSGCGFGIFGDGATGTFMQADDTLSPYPTEDYVTVQNIQLGAGESTTGFDGYTYNSTYGTSSVVYKVKVTATGDFGIRIRETAAWNGGYLFQFSSSLGKINYPTKSGKNAWSAGGLFSSGDTLEVGAIDIKGQDKAFIVVRVNGVTKVSVYAPKATTGKAVTVWGGTFEQVDDISSMLSDYVTVQNIQLGAGESVSIFEGLTYNSSYDTSSVVYKVKVTATGDFGIRIRETTAWNDGYLFQFSSSLGKIYYPTMSGENVWSEGGLFSSEDTLEVGAIDIKNSNYVYVYVKVNGETKVSSCTTKATTGNSITVWGATFEQVDDISSMLVDYVTVQNTELGMGDNFNTDECTSNYACFGYETDKATTSVAYKFNYTHSVTSYVGLRNAKDGWAGYKLVFSQNGQTGYIQFGVDDNNLKSVCEFTPSETLSVEFGAIDVKNSCDVYVYVKIGGELKASAVFAKLGTEGSYVAIYGAGGSGTFSECPYNYTITDNDGAVLDQGTVNAGETIVFNTSSLTDGTKVFAGFVYEGKLYKTLDEAISVKSSGDFTVIAKTVDLSLKNGAAIKYVNNGSDASIRFKAYIDKTDADEFVSDFGLLLAGYSQTKDCVFTHEGLSGRENYCHDIKKSADMSYIENPEDASQYYFSIYLNSISLGNYGMKYAVRAYVKVGYADGSIGYVYTPFDEENNVRSVYDVASSAMADPKETKKDLLKKYVNGVIELDDDFNIVGTERDYEVSVSEASDGYRTVTVTANNGFDLTQIGAIYIAGEKIEVTDASLNSDKTVGTFKIAESNISALTIKKIEEDVKASSSSDKALEIFAYEGPKAGIRFDANGTAGYAGGTATLEVLEEYMNAGFTHWLVTDASYGNSFIGHVAEGTGITNTNLDIFWALDLAAEYAAKYKKACPVYVLIPAMVNFGTESDISTAYDELTSYVDKNNGAYAPVNGKSQLAGFILKDEPKYSEYDNFARVFKYLAYDKGAIAAGYGFECALLQTYTSSEYINGNYSAYVAKYAELLKDTSISFDNYPCNYTPYVKGFLGIGSQKESWSMEQSWFSDMQTVRSQNNKIYGTCIQSYTAGQANSKSPYKRITCEADISMQVYTALAYGFTRLNYFTYWQRDTDLYYSGSEVFQNTMVRWNDYNDWTKGYNYSDLYYWGVNANKKATKLAEILMYFDSVGVQLVQGGSKQTDFTGATDTNTTNAITASSTGALVVGGFKCGDYNGYLASNVTLPHDNFTATATFNFGTQYTKAIVYKDGVPTVQKLSGGALTLNIASGDGLFIVPIA